MTSVLEITVHGTPAPQGSHRGFVNPKNGRVIITNDSKKTRPWRHDVTAAALNAIAEQTGEHQPMTGPVRIDVHFYLQRPKAHYRTGKLAHLLKDNAPRYVEKKPDTDKLLRSTFDALSDAGVWIDDNQAAVVIATKEYATPPHRLTGARITVAAITPLDSAVAVTSTPTAAADTPAGALF